MTNIRGFSPICEADAHTLILGSMPGRESLLQQRYYAHPRNSFWPIVTDLFGMTTQGYAQNAEMLGRQGIAVWDVLKACFRSSSLDSDIDDSSIITNDFETFFTQYPHIDRIFFNGAKAESIYRKQVLPGLPDIQAGIALHRLPSTSPAHAGMTVADKRQAWMAIVK